MMTGMVKAGDQHINPVHVSHTAWDRRHYANGPGDSFLVVTMVWGEKIRIPHQPYNLGGIDAYEVERGIVEGVKAYLGLPPSDQQRACA
jgi:hypothetical protein